MENSKLGYVSAVIFHALLGVLFFYIEIVSTAYAMLIIVGGVYYVVRNYNRNEEVLVVCGYIIGMEVLLRMTNGNFVYEYGKYSVIFFVLLGMYFKGFSKNAIPYLIVLILLVPGVALAMNELHFDERLRKSIAFNISGPVCLAIAAMYAYQRDITFEQINRILLFVGLPIISTVLYLALYSPNLSDVIRGTSSNFETSGGFGPNQVSTVLGLGVFVFFTRIAFASKSYFFVFFNLAIMLLITYRGLITFSRGGMITGFILIILLLMITYLKTNYSGKKKIAILVIFGAIGFFMIWGYTSVSTSGLIGKRYANQDAKGREKESLLTGREHIMDTELKYFMENPIFGVGVAMGAQKRAEETGTVVTSHNETTRLLAEHGLMGIIILFILLSTPLLLYLGNRNHIYLMCFFVFWLLTINHAAMRLAAPAFIYALTLLKVVKNEELVVHRE